MEKKSKPHAPDLARWMASVAEPKSADTRLHESPIQCPTCNRNNAPTRFNCLYCGAEFAPPQPNQATPLVLRELEEWENGWNVILPPNQILSEQAAVCIADFLHRDQTAIRSIFAADSVLTLARVESSSAAETIAERLRAQTIETRIVADANLEMKMLPKRVRRIEFGADEIVLRLLGAESQIIAIPFDAIELFVGGSLYEQQTENTGERSRRKQLEIKDSYETGRSDDVLDFYVAGESTNFRISANNFDFSGLGANKKMLAHENFKILLEELRVRSPNATFDDSYNRLRNLLNSVWRLQERRESIGWQRSGVGKIKIENSLTVSNANQFLRYSRMLRELLDKRFN